MKTENKISLDMLVEELNKLAEERELLMAAEQKLSRREQRLESFLMAAGGNHADVAALRRVAARRRAMTATEPEEITKRLCWPGYVYAPVRTEYSLEELLPLTGKL